MQAQRGVFEVCARASKAGWMARCIGSSSELRAPSCSRGGCACANDARAWGGKVECKGGRPKAKQQTRRPVEGSNRMDQPRPQVDQSTQSHNVSRKLSLASAAAVVRALRLQKKCAAGRSRHATSASTRAFSSVFYIEASSPLVRAAGATSATPSEKIEVTVCRRGREGGATPTRSKFNADLTILLFAKDVLHLHRKASTHYLN